MISNMIVKIIPDKVKYSPFLKIVVLGKNIQKEETTKKNSDNPKNTFKKNNGSFVDALCNLVSLSTKGSSSLDLYLAKPVSLL